MTNKYGARRTTVNGVTFDSKREAERWLVLLALLQAGAIRDLERQPSYRFVINGLHVCTYRADFRYREGDTLVVEDVKGCRTIVYSIKKKLMKALYHIDVRET